jgi:hypothetical protein
MATINISSLAAPQFVAPNELKPGTLYYTAQAKLAYAATKTCVVLFEEEARILFVAGAAADEAYVKERFPFTRAPAGTAVTLTQADVE